jgi:benzoylformate decarboxylase
VREATLDVLRAQGLTTLFSNPGSTEVPLLVDLPVDIRFVLALHEGSVVGLATGWAIGSGRPGIALLHTTAGLGNAVGALATARANRVPLVVIVGQQDRRHLAAEPFLAGHLRGLAGDYPVWQRQPARPQDVPAAILRAVHEANTGRGPALVIVPMDDWLAPMHELPLDGADRVVRPVAADQRAVDALVPLVERAQSPAIVAGAGAASTEAWRALVDLAERLGCPVFQEAFGARAGFPQDHRLFAGQLPAERGELRARLGGHDLVLVVGAPAFRQYSFQDGPFVDDTTCLALISEDPDEVHRSPVALGVLGSPAEICEQLATRVKARQPSTASPGRRAPELIPPREGELLHPAHVLAALGERLPPDAVVVEETPSSRAELERRLPARTPLGFLSAAMGGLGFAMPAAIGVRMAQPARPVLTVVGDGSSLYQIQSLWSAVHYQVGVLFVVMRNGGYAIMDRLAGAYGGTGPWPGLERISISGLAEALGCPARTIARHDQLLSTLDEVIPGLADRTEPLLLEVAVSAGDPS